MSERELLALMAAILGAENYNGEKPGCDASAEHAQGILDAVDSLMELRGVTK